MTIDFGIQTFVIYIIFTFSIIFTDNFFGFFNIFNITVIIIINIKNKQAIKNYQIKNGITPYHNIIHNQ